MDKQKKEDYKLAFKIALVGVPILWALTTAYLIIM